MLLLDENTAPGGQVHREVGGFCRPGRGGPGAAQAAEGLRLIEDLRASGAETRFGATLWAVEEDLTIAWSESGAARQARAAALLLCPGATERPVPIPGWTLPGVMGVGAPQILLKSAGLLPEGKVWLAGQGPLMWLYAAQVLAKGGALAGLLDLSPPGAWTRAAWHLPRALQGCAHEWDKAQGSLRPLLDALGNTTRAGVLVAGDAGGVGGARAAALLGRIAALEPARRLGLLFVEQRAAGPLILRRDVELAPRPFLDALYPPLPATRIADATILCRCEEVTAGRVRAAPALGAQGPNQLIPNPVCVPSIAGRRLRRLGDAGLPAGRIRGLGPAGRESWPARVGIKANLRAGMGACQGRVCGPAVQAVMAAARGVEPGLLDGLRTRLPTKPVTVGELASLA